MNPFEDLPGEIAHLLETIAGQQLWGPFTTYTPFIIFILLLVVVIVFTARRHLAMVPKNRAMGVFEFFVDFTKDQIGYGVLGPSAKKHLPFLLTIFIFILTANLIGIIPGSKAATGTIGATAALTIISFTYFTFYGIKHHGAGHYLLSYIPKVKPTPLAWVVGFLEFFSMVLRLLTLSVRLFANMFAGHLLLGMLAILTTLFITPLIQNFSAENALGVASIAWFLLLSILYFLELFVAVIQAFVFTLLSSVYIMLATTEH
jgi:F-type H+-transporting ATPase subunit a